MSRTYHNGERRIRVRGERRSPTDLRRLARALIDLAQAQAEADAEAEHQTRTGNRKRSSAKRKPRTSRGKEAV